MAFAFLKQPTTGPDAKMCGFYALYHYLNGALTKSDYLAKATTFYQQTVHVDAATAAEMAADGNDPAVYAAYGLQAGDASVVNSHDVVIVCDTAAGHFFCLRKIAGVWWNYDSFGRDAPQQLGDATAAQAKCGKFPVYHA